MGKKRMWEKLLWDRPLEVDQKGCVEGWVSHPAEEVPCTEPPGPGRGSVRQGRVWERGRARAAPRPGDPCSPEPETSLRSCALRLLCSTLPSLPKPGGLIWEEETEMGNSHGTSLFVSGDVSLCSTPLSALGKQGSRGWAEGRVRLLRLSLQRAPEKMARKYRTCL